MGWRVMFNFSYRLSMLRIKLHRFLTKILLGEKEKLWIERQLIDAGGGIRNFPGGIRRIKETFDFLNEQQFNKIVEVLQKIPGKYLQATSESDVNATDIPGKYISERHVISLLNAFVGYRIFNNWREREWLKGIIGQNDAEY